MDVTSEVGPILKLHAAQDEALRISLRKALIQTKILIEILIPILRHCGGFCGFVASSGICTGHIINLEYTIHVCKGYVTRRLNFWNLNCSFLLYFRPQDKSLRYSVSVFIDN